MKLRTQLVVWTFYLTVVAALIFIGIYEGVIIKLYNTDASHVGAGIFVLYLAAEICATRDFTRHEIDYPNVELTEIFSSTIMMLGLIATLGGIIWAFLPLAGQALDMDILRAHMPDIFAGIAVSFIPALVAFAAKACLDISIFIREN